MADCRARVREIAHQVQLSQGSALTILHDHLKVKKLCAQWVPLELTAEQKKQRTMKSELGLKLFRRDKGESSKQFVTVNEIWIYHIKSTSPAEDAQNGSQAVNNQRPKKRKRIQQQQQQSSRSDDKVLATVFWDASGLILIDYLGMGSTKFTIDQYIDLFDRLDNKLSEKRPQITKQSVLFHCDTIPGLATTNLSSFATTKLMAKLKDLKYELLLHPQYSPELDPSEFYLLPNLKGWLQGKRFATRTQLDVEINGYFDGFDHTYFTRGVEMLEERWSKCIELHGNYIDG